MLIRAIVSGEGERRMSSGTSRMGDEGAEEVKGNEERLRGSGRLKGAGAGSAWVICGMGGKRWFEIGTSLFHQLKTVSEQQMEAYFFSPATANSQPGPTTGKLTRTAS